MPSERPFNPDFSFVEQQANGHLQPAEVNEDVVQELLRKRESVIKAAMDIVPNSTEGLNMLRVNSFLKKYGLDPQPMIVVSPEDKDKFIQGMNRLGISIQFGGAHTPAFGITYVCRDSEMEEKNGVGITEQHLIHEAAHASSDYQTWVVTKFKEGNIIGGPERIGQKVRSESSSNIRGEFFEEGFAEFMGYLYTRDELGLVVGFGSRAEGQSTTVTITDENDPRYRYSVRMPNKYLSEAPEDGQFTFSSAALSCYGLELILNKDDELFPILLQARTDPTALRDFVKHLNTLDPELYKELRLLGYNLLDFAKGVKLIIDKLYGGDEELAVSTVMRNSRY